MNDDELSLEVLGGLIKVSGSANFDNDEETTGRNVEKLLCQYKSERFIIDVLPEANEILDQFVVDKINSGQIKATHFVQQIVIGAEIDASFKIESLKLKKA